ncbi:MAG TPA: metal-dependent hydrolase [Candidatus Acidoferrales bacterium]|nr:metal-dependent hydrolase [Candidatus Acidoferrales bacterium]
MNLGANEITFCGQATFAIKTQSGKHWIIDPWLDENPVCPTRLKNPAKVDTLLITHAHFDHIGDALRLAGKHDLTALGINETVNWLHKKGVKKIVSFNKGGTIEHEGLKVTMTHAVHSCGIADGEEIIYGGEACGYVITLENGVRIYHAGDTMVFGDMKIIGELFKPDIALLPIGGHYTMDPLQGAHAIRLLGTKVVVPMHYGTFPVLTGTPEQLRDLTKEISGLQIIDLRPGETLTGELQRLVPA